MFKEEKINKYKYDIWEVFVKQSFVSKKVFFINISFNKTDTEKYICMYVYVCNYVFIMLMISFNFEWVNSWFNSLNYVHICMYKFVYK